MGVTSVACNFVMLKYLVRYLPAQEAGVWLLFLTMGSYLAVFDLGISPTIGREISLALGQRGIPEEERDSRIRNLIATGSRILTFLACALTIICGTAGYFYLSTIVDFNSVLGHRTTIGWFVFVIAAAASVSGEIWLAALYGFGSVVIERLLRTGGYILWVAMSIVVLESGGGLVGLSLAWFYAFAIRVLAKQVFLRSSTTFRQSGQVDWQLGKSVSGKSLKYAGTLIGGTLILYTDNIVIASVLGPAAVPNYYAVARLVSACLSVALLISTASSPFISAAFAAGNMDEVRRITMRNVRIAMALMTTGGCFLAFFGKSLIQLWIGEGDFVGFGVLLVMLSAMTLEAHHVSLATSTMACDKIPFLFPALIAGALNLALSIPLAYRFGLVGVALGTFLAQVTTNNWYVSLYSLRYLRIRPFQYAVRVILPSAALLIGVAALDYGLLLSLRGHGKVTLVAVGMIVNGTVLGGFLFFTGVVQLRKSTPGSGNGNLDDQKVALDVH
jgi:O-antigen/teichoic acid export membrane protein